MPGKGKVNKIVVIVAVAALVFTGAAYAEADDANIPSWLELRMGQGAYTDDDDGGGASTLTVCDTARAYLKWADLVKNAGQHCTSHARGVPVTISSNDVVAVDLGSAETRYVVSIRADDSSWSGWTDSGLQPRIPPKTRLTVRSAHLAPDKDSKEDAGPTLDEGSIVEALSQDARSESRTIYVKVITGQRKDATGWLYDLDIISSFHFAPIPSTVVNYQYDCDYLVPRSHFYDIGDYDAALAEIAPLAKPGCPEAEHLLGVMYGKGQGVNRDPVRAYALLLVAFYEGVRPYGAAIIPVLGSDPHESEIVQFGQTLSPEQLSKSEELALQLGASAKNDTGSLPEVIKQVHSELGRRNKLFRVAPACFKVEQLTVLLDALANGEKIKNKDFFDYGCTILPAHIPVIVKQTDDSNGAACISQTAAGHGCMWVPSAALHSD
jgi:hypothetical protein